MIVQVSYLNIYNFYRRVPFSRRNVFIRDKNTCQYCGCQFIGHRKLTIDHIIPISRGGERRTFNNCVTSCSICNNFKNNRTPKEAGMNLLTTPKVPRFFELLMNRFNLNEEELLVYLIS